MEKRGFNFFDLNVAVLIFPKKRIKYYPKLIFNFFQIVCT